MLTLFQVGSGHTRCHPGVDANLGIDSEIEVDAENRRQNSKWTKNSTSCIILFCGCQYRTSTTESGCTESKYFYAAPSFRKIFKI